MTLVHPYVVLLDLDNTLIDNDRIKADLSELLLEIGGPEIQRSWTVLYEQVRSELGVVSIPLTMQRFAAAHPDSGHAARVADLLMRYPYRRRVFPGALAALRRLRRLGPLAILSDGEPWFQMKKICGSGLDRAVEGNVMLFAHKEDHLDDVFRWYPAERYIFIDDKPRLGAVLKKLLGDRVTTVWVRQGSYAAAGWDAAESPADIVLDSIAAARTIHPARHVATEESAMAGAAS